VVKEDRIVVAVDLPLSLRTLLNVNTYEGEKENEIHLDL